MSVEVIGVDHVFVAVSDLRRSEGFYNRVIPILGFRKGDGTIGGDPHLFYYNRQFACSLRPATEGAPDHDPYAPGLHHPCLRVVDEAAVDRAVRGIREAGDGGHRASLLPGVRPGLLRDVLRGPRRREARGDELPGDQAKGHAREARAGL